jgi:hypothetical protein
VDETDSRSYLISGFVINVLGHAGVGTTVFVIPHSLSVKLNHLAEAGAKLFLELPVSRT